MLVKQDNGIIIYCYETKHEKNTIFYITVVVSEAIKDRSGITLLFTELNRYLQEKDIQIVLEKIYGVSSSLKEIGIIREKHYKNCIPYTFIEGTPCVGGKIAGVQVIGVTTLGAKGAVGTIFNEGIPIGRIFETKDFKEIFIAGVSGVRGGNNRGNRDTVYQTKTMFNTIKDILSKQGMAMQDVVRTWIYLPEIHDCYEQFNKTRTKCFKEYGMLSSKNARLPASTAIQGRRNKQEIFMDALGFVSKSGNAAVNIMKSDCQSNALEYGSAFSRGMEIKIDNISTMYISGTASINNRGQTVNLADEQGQIKETLNNVDILLRRNRSNLRNLVMAMAYCKNEKTYKVFKKTVNYLGLKNRPFIPVYADICRDDLLFEVDAIALHPVGCKLMD